MSTILDALRRAQQADNAEAERATEAQSQQAQPPIESTIPAPEPLPAAGTGPDDSPSYRPDTPPAESSAMDTSASAPLRDWRVAAVVAGGLAIGLGLAGLFGEADPPPIELADKVAEQLAEATVAKESPAEIPDAVASRRAKRRAANSGAAPEPKMAPAPAAKPAPSAPPPPRPAPTASAKPLVPAVPPVAAAKPPVLQPAGKAAPPAARPEAVTPPANIASKTGAKPEAPLTGLAALAASAAAAKRSDPANPAKLAVQPARPGPGTPPPPGAKNPPGAAPPRPPVHPIRQVRPGTAVPPTRPVPVAPVAAAGSTEPAQPEGELLDAAPEGAPHLDLLFIRWKTDSADRVVSVRTGGQRIVVLRENDIVEGMKVSRIEPGGVEFQWRGQRFMVLASRY